MTQIMAKKGEVHRNRFISDIRVGMQLITNTLEWKQQSGYNLEMESNPDSGVRNEITDLCEACVGKDLNGSGSEYISQVPIPNINFFVSGSWSFNFVSIFPDEFIHFCLFDFTFTSGTRIN